MIKDAFPKYDTATLPAIPEGWEDVSWRHDACPSWQFENFHIFIDSENPSERETGGERYFINDAKTGDCFLVTDNWDDVLNYVNGIKKQRIGVNCRDRPSAERIAVCQFKNNPKIGTIDGGYRVTWELKQIQVLK